MRNGIKSKKLMEESKRRLIGVPRIKESPNDEVTDDEKTEVK